MLTWLGILSSVLTIANTISAYLKDKQILSAGQATVIANSIQGALDVIAEAKKIRDKSNIDYDNGVSTKDDPTDPYRRKD